MICEKCNIEMIIDEWSGWIWTCHHCGKEDRKATDAEFKKWEEQIMSY